MPSLQLMLNKMGSEVSTVWGDTVLEGHMLKQELKALI